MGRPQPRTREELLELLAQQRAGLAASCENYDKGNDWEAARLAIAIFNLVHDGGGIVSLLTRLGVRSKLQYVASAPEINRRNLVADTPLVMYRSRQTPHGVVHKAIPLLGDGPPYEKRLLSFDKWWANDLVFRDGQHELSRRRIIFALRHQEGGSHVGDLTDEAYVRLKTTAICYGISSNQPETPMFALTATTRQIAWELTKTIDEHGPIQ